MPFNLNIPKSVTPLIAKNKFITVHTRTIVSTIALFAKQSAVRTVIGVSTTMKTREYSLYRVTDNESQQDSSKTNHPAVVKEQCQKENCNEKNCAESTGNCDLETKETSIIGHLTHQKENTVPLESVKDTRGDSFVKIYDFKELIKEKDSYEGYNYNLSRRVQVDKNTSKLNENTKNQKDYVEQPNNNDENSI